MGALNPQKHTFFEVKREKNAETFGGLRKSA